MKRSWSAPRLDLGDVTLVPAARRVVEGALSLVPGERLCVLADRRSRDVAEALVRAAGLVPATAEVLMLEELGHRPLLALPPAVQEALARAQASAFVAEAPAEELPFRRALIQLVERLHLRHAHMIDVTRDRFIAGFAVDPQRIADVARMLRVRLREDSRIDVRSVNGATLEVHCGPGLRWTVLGGVVRPGRWQNLPAAELFTSPARVDGTYLANASHSGLPGVDGTALSATPLEIEVRGGVVTAYTGGTEQLRQALARFLEQPEASRVGLVSFGTNVGLDRAAGAVILDQTLPGVHLVLGRSHAELTGASWEGTVELTLAGWGADVDIDGEPVIRSGRYLL